MTFHDTSGAIERENEVLIAGNYTWYCTYTAITWNFFQTDRKPIPMLICNPFQAPATLRLRKFTIVVIRGLVHSVYAKGVKLFLARIFRQKDEQHSSEGANSLLEMQTMISKKENTEKKFVRSHRFFKECTLIVTVTLLCTKKDHLHQAFFFGQQECG